MRRRTRWIHNRNGRILAVFDLRVIKLELFVKRYESICKLSVVDVVTKKINSRYLFGFVCCEKQDDDAYSAAARAPAQVQRVTIVFQEITHANTRYLNKLLANCRRKLHLAIVRILLSTREHRRGGNSQRHRQRRVR